MKIALPNFCRLTAVCSTFFLAGTLTKVLAQENKAHYNPPQIIKSPQDNPDYLVGNRKFTGIPSLAISRGGKLWSVWYAGKTPDEDRNNYVVVSTSTDTGKTWKEVMVIDPDGEGPVRAYDPEIWFDPDGKLWLFWSQAVSAKDTWALVAEGTTAGVWTMSSPNAEDENPEWSKPGRIADGVMMCKPTVLSNGEWALPVSNWSVKEKSAGMVVTKDRGKSWEVRGGATVPEDARHYDEHIIVEKKDGTLWMLVRTRYGVGESISRDLGKTWTPLTPSKIRHPSARLFIRRLNSGNLLLVKHGPIDLRIQRTHLMAFISKDDGHTWSKGLLIDERPGVSYPDGQQSKDGRIFIVYDYSRKKEQEILLTSFTEDDILSGDYDRKIITIFDNRLVVSKGGK